MWLDNLKELKKRTGMSSKQIADMTHLPERTVSRIFSGDTDDPYASTLQRIVKAMGGSLDDILADTNVVVTTERFTEVKENANAAEAQLAQMRLALEEAEAKNAALTTENERLKMEVKHKSDLLAVFEYFLKDKPTK